MVGPLPPQIGGIEFFLDGLLHSKLCRLWPVKHFDLSKPKSRIKTHFQSPMGYARSFKRNIFTTLISFSYSLFYFIKYLLIIPQRRWALVHLHTSSYMSFWEKCLYLNVAKLFNKKVVLHVHGSSFDRFIYESNQVSKKLILFHLRRFDCVVTLSPSWYRFFNQFLPKEKLAIVENGIDVTFYATGEEQKSLIPTVLFIGEVCQRKGIYDLIPSMVSVRQRQPNIHCVVIGPGEIEKARRMADSLGLTDCFQFCGPLHGEEKRAWMKNAWFLVLPSYAEVLPLVILEAFAAGLPVIATKVGGIPDLIQVDENGLLLEPGDQNALSEAILMLSGEEALRRHMAECNQKLAFERYDINVCAEKIDAIYRQLLSSSKSTQ